MRRRTAEDDIRDIQAAALDPTAWSVLLGLLAERFGADNAALAGQDPRTGRGQGLTYQLDSQVPGLYYGYFAARYPLVMADRAATVFGRRAALPVDELGPDLARTEYAQDFLRPHRMSSLLSLVLAYGEGGTVLLNFGRDSRRPFTTEQRDHLTALMPHLIHALRVTRALGGLGIGGAALLEALPHGAMMIDATGRVLHANALAMALVRTGDILLAEGQLAAPQAEADRRLQRLLLRATGADGQPPAGGSLAMTGVEDGRLLVLANPVLATAAPLVFAAPAAVVLLLSPAASFLALPDEIAAALGLTAAENRVAGALLDGGDPAEIARRLGIGIATVRTHLARLMDKTGTRRQAELVGVFTRLALPRGGEGGTT